MSDQLSLIIAGSRSLGSYMLDGKRQQLTLDQCSWLEDGFTESGLDGKVWEIVSGTAYGVDQLGEEFAIYKTLKLAFFPADWATHGRAAGPIRNREMGDYAGAALIFWDGKSRGALNMFKYTKKIKKPVFLFTVKNNEIVEREFYA